MKYLLTIHKALILTKNKPIEYVNDTKNKIQAHWPNVWSVIDCIAKTIIVLFIIII